MACNENVIKNMANEVTRNCQPYNINVEPEFVAFLIELLLLNPKYGKLFKKTLSRNNLAYFVDECVAMISRGGTTMNTLKMQFIMRANYDKLQILIDKHLDSVDTCIAPLLKEILESDPKVDDVAEYKKIYRKISIYILLFSGLGNPAVIMNLKEGMAALESVFGIEQLGSLLSLPRSERRERLDELVQIVSGVRLFNRDCKKGGEMLPELPFELVNASNASLSSLSNSLMSVMQRVSTLTAAIEDQMVINPETNCVEVNVQPNSKLIIEDYNDIFGLLIFYRQYEIYNRRLLNDVDIMVDTSRELFDKYRKALEDLHNAVKYKTAVPCDTVFPLFSRLWAVWRAMQNTMFLVGTVDRLWAILKNIQEGIKIPKIIINRMLEGKTVISNEERTSSVTAFDHFTQVSQQYLSPIQSSELLQSTTSEVDIAEMAKERHIMFLGFCAMCLNVGALVPANFKIGLIKHKGQRYGFCTLKMAAKFAKDPESGIAALHDTIKFISKPVLRCYSRLKDCGILDEKTLRNFLNIISFIRYVNEMLQYARNNPHIIHLLNMEEDVRAVKDVEPLVAKTYAIKKLLNHKDIQTEVHPIEEYIEHNYSWDLWEWKRRACQWANIVKCQTHSTQTNYSHLRSETHCQTVEPRDKAQQTMKEAGINTSTCNYFLWGLRGQIGDGQHMLDMVPKHEPENATPEHAVLCKWPCVKHVTHSNETIHSHFSFDSNDSFGYEGSSGSDGDFYMPI